MTPPYSRIGLTIVQYRFISLHFYIHVAESLKLLFIKPLRNSHLGFGTFTTFSGRLFHINFVIRIGKLYFLRYKRGLS